MGTVYALGVGETFWAAAGVVVALVVGLGGIGLSVWSIITARTANRTAEEASGAAAEANRLAAKVHTDNLKLQAPILDVKTYAPGDTEVQVVVHNYGSGPAVSVSIRFDDDDTNDRFPPFTPGTMRVIEAGGDGVFWTHVSSDEYLAHVDPDGRIRIRWANQLGEYQEERSDTRADARGLSDAILRRSMQQLLESDDSQHLEPDEHGQDGTKQSSAGESTGNEAQAVTKTDHNSVKSGETSPSAPAPQDGSPPQPLPQRFQGIIRFRGIAKSAN